MDLASQPALASTAATPRPSAPPRGGGLWASPSTSPPTTAPELAGLLRTLTDRLRLLTRGGAPEPVGISAPPPGSGVLGPDVPADALTATGGFGASLLDDRFGLAPYRPRRPTRMETFPGDALAPGRCHGDLLLQLCADHQDTLMHALRDVARHTRGGMQVRWRIDGFASPPRPSGTPRNLLGRTWTAGTGRCSGGRRASR